MPEVQRYEVETATGTCVNCEARAAVPGHSTNLCGECRKLFIRFPIPLWIKLFAGGVCLVILFSLFTFPDNLSVAIHLSRGKKAADNNRYVTARKELEKVIIKYPHHVEARGYLMLAAYYNRDYDAFVNYEKELEGVEIANERLWNRIIDAQESINAYYADDSMRLLQKLYDSVNLSLPDSVVAQFIQRNPNNYSALFTYANILYDGQKYAACESVLIQLLEKDDTHIPTLQLMAHAKRQVRDYNAAIKYCERVLEINKESAYTYSIMARTYLQQRRDKEGFDMAVKAIGLDEKHQYVRATLALAFHFTHQNERRDELLKEAKASKDTLTRFYFDYVNDVINNKEQFR